MGICYRRIPLDRYQSIVFDDLVHRVSDFFGSEKSGNCSLFPGTVVSQEDLIRVPLLWDRYLFALVRQGLLDVKARVPEPADMECDYFLSRDASIVRAPEHDYVLAKIQVLEDRFPMDISVYLL